MSLAAGSSFTCYVKPNQNWGVGSVILLLFSTIRTISTIEHCCFTALFLLFSEIYRHQGVMILWFHIQSKLEGKSEYWPQYWVTQASINCWRNLRTHAGRLIVCSDKSWSFDLRPAPRWHESSSKLSESGRLSPRGSRGQPSGDLSQPH